MKQFRWISAFVLSLCLGVTGAQASQHEGEWHSLFNGKNLDGWKVTNDNPESIKVEDGKIVCHGPRAHAFYMGEVENHDFKNFHLKLDIMTHESANSGVYIHTRYQETGWPESGYEVQVNNTMKREPQKTGGLYNVAKVTVPPVPDEKWFTMDIIVKDQHVSVKVNGVALVDYTEDEDSDLIKQNPKRQLSHGTIALQAHDPGSKIFYKNIKIKPLP